MDRDTTAVIQLQMFPDQGIDLGDMTFGPRQKGRSPDDKGHTPPKQITPVAPGSYGSAAILLLSDGRRTTGVDTLEAAKMAADRGVRIYVVGLGTVDGDTATPDGLAIYMKLDEPTLREVARMTGGEYFHAGTAETTQHQGARNFHNALQKAGINSVFEDVPGTAHDWQTWRWALYGFAPRLFQDPKGAGNGGAN